MAVLAAIATGNFLTAGTWGVTDSAAYNNTETTTTALTTSYQASAGTTTGIETLDGVGLKLSVRTGTTGTMSVHLAIATVEVPGTLVTINTADLPVAATADLNGGWIFFKFASPVTLAGATSYTVEAKTSSASQVSLFSTSGSDWARYFRTTTTQAPAAGDDLIITGIHTTTGAPTAVTVTMNETATTDYGAASTSLVTPSLAIGNSGTLTYGATAATNYYLRQSGNVIVYSSGTLSIGTTGTPIPRDGSAILNFDSAANVDFGLTVRNLGTWNSQGLSRTVSNTTFYCKLNTDEAIASTSLGVDTDTGWLDNDAIGVASTTQTASQCESGALNGAAGASTLTVDGFGGAGGGLAAAHSGTSPTQAEVILLTRNVQIFGASASLQAYIDIKATATVDVDWTEFKWLGSATANKRGIDLATTTGSFSMQFSSLHDFSVASSLAFNATGSSGNGYTFSSNVLFNTANSMFTNANTSNTTWTADSNIFMKGTSGTGCALADIGGTFTNNIIVGITSSAVQTTDSGTFGTWSGNTVHSSGGGIIWQTPIGGTVSTLTVWRSGGGMTFNGTTLSNIIFETGTLFGNASSNISMGNGIGNVTFNSYTSNGDTTFATTSGVALSSSSAVNVFFNSCNFSTVSGIKTAHTNDFSVGSAPQSIFLNNTKLGAATEVSNQTGMPTPLDFISSEKHDQTAGTHKTWKKYGTITIDTTANMFRTASPSERLTPNNASNKLVSGIKRAAVTSGSTLTPSVWVRESVVGDGTDYNGNRIRLIVKRNDAVGITADTVLATASVSSEGAFEQLTAATAAATDDGVMEFFVDCDGTTGWINDDDWSVT